MRIEIGAVAVLTAASAVGSLVGFWPALAPARMAAIGGEPISGCRATDGDTIRCGDERIRLLGIDAPELPGHCRKGRDCAPGDPFASRASLAREVARGGLTIERVGEDRYGRTLALVRGVGGDLSCRQIEGGYARYVARWDDGRALAGQCEAAG